MSNILIILAFWMGLLLAPGLSYLCSWLQGPGVGRYRALLTRKQREIEHYKMITTVLRALLFVNGKVPEPLTKTDPTTAPASGFI